MSKISITTLADALGRDLEDPATEGVNVPTSEPPLLTDDQLSRMVTAMEASGDLVWADTARHALSGDEGARRDCTAYIRSL